MIYMETPTEVLIEIKIAQIQERMDKMDKKLDAILDQIRKDEKPTKTIPY